MAFYGNRYGNSYSYEAEREVVRDEYNDRFQAGCANIGGYNMGHHHQTMVTDVCETDAIPRYGHHHHGGATEFIEREERIVYENDYDSCNTRRYC